MIKYSLRSLSTFAALSTLVALYDGLVMMEKLFVVALSFVCVFVVVWFWRSNTISISNWTRTVMYGGEEVLSKAKISNEQLFLMTSDMEKSSLPHEAK